MTEEKFDKRYFDIHYHIKDNIVYRNEDSSGECQGAKEKCLRACFTHFLKEDLIGTKSISNYFTTNGKERRLDGITRCCCSQFEETWITHVIITHKLTKLSFIVGKDCFRKLFWEAEDVETFFKEECKYCGKIVAKRADDRPNFCKQECVKEYEKQERRKKMVYVPPPKKIWTKKIWLECSCCKMPKKTENHQKYEFCWLCNETNKLKIGGEIYGYSD